MTSQHAYNTMITSILGKNHLWTISFLFFCMSRHTHHTHFFSFSFFAFSFPDSFTFSSRTLMRSQRAHNTMMTFTIMHPPRTPGLLVRITPSLRALFLLHPLPSLLCDAAPLHSPSLSTCGPSSLSSTHFYGLWLDTHTHPPLTIPWLASPIGLALRHVSHPVVHPTLPSGDVL